MTNYTTAKTLFSAWMRTAAALLIGCADLMIIGATSDCAEDGNNAAPNRPDAGFEDTDHTIEPDTTDEGARLERPARVEILVVPARAIYQPDTLIQTGFQVYDGRGVLMSEQSVTWSVAPTSAATREGKIGR